MAVNPNRALLNQDVIYAIFEHLTVPDALWYDYDTAARRMKSTGDTAERTATLARCGRVCKAFLFPAMSILWRNIDSLETLCALAQRSTSQDAEVAVSAGLSWLPTYAQYLHWVRMISNPSSILARSYQVTTPNDGLKLAVLPQPTHLRWVQEVPGTMDLLSLLSPSLSSLHILFRNLRNVTSHEHPAFVEALLLHAAERAPNLMYLRITRASGIPEEWLRPVDQFTRLEVLDISEPSYDKVTTCDLLPRLATMESLRSLKFRLPTATIHSASNPGNQYFGALRDVHLDCKHASLHDAIAFVRAISSRYVESVHVDDCDCPTTSLSAGLLELCTVLHASFASTLRAISLSVTPIGPLVVFERPLVEYLEPLLHIRELTEFRLRVSRTSNNVSMPASESDLAAIAEAWPRITQLRLNFDSVGGPAVVPVRTLLVFARYCPLLTTLEVPCIDARGVEELSCELGDPHLSLTSCGVLDGGWDSLIPDPEGFARFLKTLFPNVTLGRQRLEAEPWRRTVESLERLRLGGR